MQVINQKTTKFTINEISYEFYAKKIYHCHNYNIPYEGIILISNNKEKPALLTNDGIYIASNTKE